MLNAVRSMLKVLGVEYTLTQSEGCYPVVSYMYPQGKGLGNKMVALYAWFEANRVAPVRYENHPLYRATTYFFEDCVVMEGLAMEG